MAETFEKLKKCKTVKEIYETLPDAFYETGSAVMMFLMLLIIVLETITRYVTKHQSLDKMIEYFTYVGYMAIIFSMIVLVVKSAGIGKKGVGEYLKNNQQDILLLIMLFYAFIAAVFSNDRETAFGGDWYRNSGFRSYLIFAAMYICGKNIKYNKDETAKVKLCINGAFLVVCTIQNLLFITKYNGCFGSKTGAFYNTNHSAYFMVISICAGVGFISCVKKAVLKVAGTVLYVVNIICLILNNTFGCYLAMIMALVFMAVVCIVKKKKMMPEIIVCIVLFVLSSVIVDYRTGIVSSNFGVTMNDVGTISGDEGDINSVGTGRMGLWINNIRYIKKHPVIGCGPDCATNVTIDSDGNDIDEKNIAANDEEQNEVIHLREAHNEYIQYAVEVGLPAALIYILALLVILKKKFTGLAKVDDSAIFDGGVVFGYCVSAFFGVIMFYTAVFYFMFLGMVSENKNTP